MNSPILSKGQQIELDIHDLGHEGQGIGRYQELAVFVDKALPGDRVRARVVFWKKTYAIAALEKILLPSKDRVHGACAQGEDCGGCSLLALRYNAQLAWKQKAVGQALERIAHICAPVLPVIGMQDPYHYRNKAQLPIGIDAQGKRRVGFYARRSHDIVSVDACALHPVCFGTIIEIVTRWMNQHQISVYEERTGKGGLRHLIIKKAFATGQIMVILVSAKPTIAHWQDLAVSLKEVKGFTSLVQNFNPGRTNVILGKKTQVLYGSPMIEEKLQDLSFEISPLSFFQVNPLQTEVLYQKVVEFAQIQPEDVVWDLYCGLGSISLFLARQAKAVYGIEIVPEAIEAARRNAARNGIENAFFYAGKTEEVLPDLQDKGIRADIAVLDPPRKGCEPAVLEALIAQGPRRIVYVSCNPATLARDIARLIEGGYALETVQPVDMFAHTPHVETVVLLNRKHS